MKTVAHPSQIVRLNKDTWEIDQEWYDLNGPAWLDPGDMVEVIETQGENSILKFKDEYWLLPRKYLI